MLVSLPRPPGFNQPGSAIESNSIGCGVSLQRVPDRAPGPCRRRWVDVVHERIGDFTALEVPEGVVDRVAYLIGRTSSSITTSSQEASLRTRLMRSESANGNAPGAPGGPRSGRGTCRRVAPAGTMTQSF